MKNKHNYDTWNYSGVLPTTRYLQRANGQGLHVQHTSIQELPLSGAIYKKWNRWSEAQTLDTGSLNSELFKISGERTISVPLVRDNHVRIQLQHWVHTDIGNTRWCREVLEKVIDEIPQTKAAIFIWTPRIQITAICQNISVYISKLYDKLTAENFDNSALTRYKTKTASNTNTCYNTSMVASTSNFFWKWYLFNNIWSECFIWSSKSLKGFVKSKEMKGDKKYFGKGSEKNKCQGGLIGYHLLSLLPKYEQSTFFCNFDIGKS